MQNLLGKYYENFLLKTSINFRGGYPVDWQVGINTNDGDKKPPAGGTWSNLDSTNYAFFADALDSELSVLKNDTVVVQLFHADGSTANAVQTGNSGNNQNIPVQGPTLRMLACINYAGIFPPRN